jgi:hypothetical protein
MTTREDGDVHAARLWRVHRTAKQMCRDRKYIVYEADINMDFNDFKKRYAANGPVE